MRILFNLGRVNRLIALLFSFPLSFGCIVTISDSDMEPAINDVVSFNSECPACLVDTLLTWPYGKSKALCFTWDDGVRLHTRHISQLFNKYDLKTTFYIVTCNIKSNTLLEEYNFVLDSGHEIGSHTVNHKILPKLSQPEIEYQVCQSAIDIKNQFGYNPTTFAHPERCMNEIVDSIILSHYLATRFSSIVKYPKRKVHSVIRKDNFEGLRSEFESFIHDDKYDWIVYSGHGLSSNTLNFIDVYEPLDSLAFDSFLSYITTYYRDYTYIATYEEIIMYQFLKDKIRLKYGNGCIGIDKSEVESVLDYYDHPKALISLLFDSDSMIFRSNALVDTVRKNGKTIVTLDIRQGTVLYYE